MMTLIVEIGPENAANLQRVGLVTSAGDGYGTAHSSSGFAGDSEKEKKGRRNCSCATGQ